MFGAGALLGNWKPIIAGLAALALVTIIVLGYRHYAVLVETVGALRADNARLSTAVELQRDTISAQHDALGEWKTAQAALVKLMRELQRATDAAAMETRRLNGIFSRHDLTNLAVNKPGRVESIINSGTRSALRVLECASGAAGADCADAGGEAEGAGGAAAP